MEREMRIKREGETCRERWKPKLLLSLIDEGFVESEIAGILSALCNVFFQELLAHRDQLGGTPPLLIHISPPSLHLELSD